MARRPFRGISVGTLFTLILTLATMITGTIIYARISGEPGELAASVLSLSHGQTQKLPGANQQEMEQSHQAQVQIIQTASAATSVPTAAPDQSVVLTAAGQIQIGTEMRNGGRQQDGSFAFPEAFSNISYLFQGNLNMATLRATLASDVADYGNYNAPDAIGLALQQSGINLLNLGTDRILDLGMEGLAATRAALKEQNLHTVGAYTALAEAESGVLVESGGVKIGVVSYVEEISGTGEERTSETERTYATRTLEETLRDIQTLREKGAEVIVALAWWGNRGQDNVSGEMRQIAQSLAQGGADVALGANPTRVLPFERIRLENGREVFVAYSLGTFLSDESRETQDIVGVILTLELRVDGQSKEVEIVRAAYTPTWIMRYRDESGANQYSVVPAGASTVPEHMTESIYSNMQRAYKNLTERVGSQEATPVAE